MAESLQYRLQGRQPRPVQFQGVGAIACGQQLKPISLQSLSKQALEVSVVWGRRSRLPARQGRGERAHRPPPSDGSLPQTMRSSGRRRSSKRRCPQVRRPRSSRDSRDCGMAAARMYRWTTDAPTPKASTSLIAGRRRPADHRARQVVATADGRGEGSKSELLTNSACSSDSCSSHTGTKPAGTLNRERPSKTCGGSKSADPRRATRGRGAGWGSGVWPESRQR